MKKCPICKTKDIENQFNFCSMDCRRIDLQNNIEKQEAEEKANKFTLAELKIIKTATEFVHDEFVIYGDPAKDKAFQTLWKKIKYWEDRTYE